MDFREVGELIEESWKRHIDGSPMFRVAKQLEDPRYQIFKWCRDYRSRTGIIWDEFSKHCEVAQLKDHEDAFGENEAEVRDNVRNRLNIQLQYWRQRGKGKWLATEDSNCKWFFRKARSRKQKNEILMIKNAKGEWTLDRTEIQETILDFYENIFQTDHCKANDISWEEPRNLNDLLPRISSSQAESPQQKFCDQEI